jgi:hypothetical protein
MKATVRPCLIGLLLAVSFTNSLKAALPVQAIFTGPRSEQAWSLAELNPELPADWSDYDFLVLEFKASSSQRFHLGLRTSAGHFPKLIGPFANVWVRASIPLRYYRRAPGDAHDMAAMYNQPRNSYWINIHTSGHGPTTNVSAITVSMDYPVGTPTLEIRSVTLAKTDPGDAVLEGKPLVDVFGQYTHATWNGKVNSLDELKKLWTAEAEAVKTALPNRCGYGGFKDTSAKATGFFRVEKVNDRWWFVCPDGHLFYSAGLNGVGTSSGTRVDGREDLFATLTPPDLTSGRGGRGGRGSFYTWNLQRRFGADWRTPWADFTTQRLAAWGFNTMHNWGAPSRTQPEPRVPFALMMRSWQMGQAIMGMPDVYSEDFARRAEENAREQLTAYRDDPYMLGIFIGNEPPWPGRESQLCDSILAGPESEMQKRLKAHLAESDTAARRKAFIIAAFQHYLDTINSAVRKHAPNHLNLGIRFGGEPHDDIIKAAHGFDVFSVNIYRYAPTRASFDRLYQLTGKPIILGEFHLGASERGMSAGLVQAMNQAERAQGYRYYVEQSAAHPAVIGTHWFQWLDQPVTGRNDGENYNIGFIDVTDQPYAEMIAGAKRTHERLFDIHSGKIPPTDQVPKASEAGTPGQRRRAPMATD